MLIGFKFEGYGDGWKALDQAGWDDLREVIPALDEKKPDYPYNSYVADTEAIRRLAKHKVQISLSEPPDSQLMFVRLQDRIEALELKKEDTAGQLTNGAAVHIHIPDHSLTKIDEVMAMEDACTDELQGYLDKDWRILAICPPNAKRRPDYILGRRRDPMREER